MGNKQSQKPALLPQHKNHETELEKLCFFFLQTKRIQHNDNGVSNEWG